MTHLFCSLLSLLVLLFAFSSAQVPMGQCGTGIASLIPYNITNGKCSFGSSVLVNTTTQVAAVNAAFYRGAALCGACFSVTGPVGTTVVKVTEECLASTPSCVNDAVTNVTQFAVSADAFFQIAGYIPSNTSSVSISFQMISCPIYGNISWWLGAGSNQDYFGVTANNIKFKIQYVEAQLAGTAWVPLVRVDYNQWICNQCFNPVVAPVSLRVFGETGEVLVDPNVLTATTDWPLKTTSTKNVIIYPGTVQFTDPLPSNCSFLSYNNTIAQPGPPAPFYPQGAIPMGTCGVATITGQAGLGGVCGFPKFAANIPVAGVDPSRFNGTLACGDCYLLTAELGSVVVTVADLCSLFPQCLPNNTMSHFNLSPYAFGLITAQHLSGNATYQKVACPITTYPYMTYTLGGGSASYYFTVLVQYNKVGITRFDVKQAGSDWVTLQKAFYGPYICNNCFGNNPVTPPVAFRMWGTSGQVLVDNNALTAISNWPSITGTSAPYQFNSTAQFQDPCPSDCLGQTQGNPICYQPPPTLPPVIQTKATNSEGAMNMASGLGVMLVTLWMVLN